MAINYPALKTELQQDPRGYGYSTPINQGNMQVPADLLNLVRDGTNGGPAINIRKASVPVKDIFEAIDVADFPDLPTNPNSGALSSERRNLSWLQMLISLPAGVRLLNPDGTNNPVVVNLSRIFPAGSATRTRLLALAQRFGSRAEELFGEGTTVSFNDIIIALRDF